MISMSGKRAAARIAGLVLMIGAARPLSAQDGLRFGPVGEGPAQYNGGYDRSFIKEWQPNPPKGYPDPVEGEPCGDQGRRRNATGDRRRRRLSGHARDRVRACRDATRPSPSLRQRLTASGDLRREAPAIPNYFGNDVDKAVKRFQASNGLAPTGIVDKRTIAALNVPAEVRLKQLKVNLDAPRPTSRRSSASATCW